jgi:hypothetical protein
VLSAAHAQLASQPGQERNLAKVNQELARVYGSYKNLSQTSTGYLSNLAKEVEYRKQSTVLMNEANKQAGIYSAHSERQFAMLQQISSQVPGGGILNKFISGASRGAAGAAEGAASGGGGGLAGGLAGGGMAAAAGIAAVAIGALVSKMGELTSRSNELAQSAANSSSQLGQLRSANERASIAKDAAASTPGVTSLAGIQAYVSKQGSDFVSNLLNSQNQISAGIKEKIAGGLGGDDKEAWRRQKEAGQDLNLDLARQRQTLDIQQARQNRDHALDIKQFNIDSANQLFDIQKQTQRQAEDYSISKAQFDENQAGKMAKQQFDLQQKYAQQGFANQMGDRSTDYGISRQRAQTDYTLARSDKAYDFGVSQSRNQTEFNISQSRNLQSRQNQIFDMAAGGASGLQWLQASRNFNQQQQYAKEDFQRQKLYANQDYSVSTARDARGFNLANQRGQQDFNLANQRSTRDFGISQNQAQEERALQIESMLYARKYEGIQLELQHNRNLQDSAIALQRFTQATGMQRQRLANQGSDLQIDQNLQNRDFNISSYRSLRDSQYQKNDLAGRMRKDDPLGAYGQGLVDPEFLDALNRNAAATGQAPLSDQVKSTIGLGGIANRKGIAGLPDNLGGFLGWGARNVGGLIGLLPPGLGGDNNPWVTTVGFKPGKWRNYL